MKLLKHSLSRKKKIETAGSAPKIEGVCSGLRPVLIPSFIEIL